MDRIAVTCEEPSLDSKVDPRFGRAAGFLIVDPDTMEFEYIDNGATQNMAQGAGIQAAENVANSGAKVLLTGNVGPKAFQGLESAGIKIAQNFETMTVRQAIEKFKAGDVNFASSSNKEGHWK